MRAHWVQKNKYVSHVNVVNISKLKKAVFTFSKFLKVCCSFSGGQFGHFQKNWTCWVPGCLYSNSPYITISNFRAAPISSWPRWVRRSATLSPRRRGRTLTTQSTRWGQCSHSCRITAAPRQCAIRWEWMMTWKRWKNFIKTDFFWIGFIISFPRK